MRAGWNSSTPQENILIQLNYTNLPADRKKLRRRFYQDYLIMLGGMALIRPNDFLAGTRTVDQFCLWSDIILVEMEVMNYEPFTNLLLGLEAEKSIAYKPEPSSNDGGQFIPAPQSRLRN